MNLCCLLTNKNSIIIINKECNKIKNIYLIILLYTIQYIHIYSIYTYLYNMSYIFESFIKLANLIDLILMDLSNFLARA